VRAAVPLKTIVLREAGISATVISNDARQFHGLSQIVLRNPEPVAELLRSKPMMGLKRTFILLGAK